ncbi:hypothetical protein ACI784_07395 [Geodermatophilus sp. SYSU D01186]
MIALLRVLARRPRTGHREVTWPCHRHRFSWAGDDAFSSSSLYACRCGVVRPGL